MWRKGDVLKIRPKDRQRKRDGPAPTNDVQKAIWEKVHAIPDKPITIEYGK